MLLPNIYSRRGMTPNRGKNMISWGVRGTQSFLNFKLERERGEWNGANSPAREYEELVAGRGKTDNDGGEWRLRIYDLEKARNFLHSFFSFN